jgi:hypothetical protein
MIGFIILSLFFACTALGVYWSAYSINGAIGGLDRALIRILVGLALLHAVMAIMRLVGW